MWSYRRKSEEGLFDAKRALPVLIILGALGGALSFLVANQGQV
jgi:hypothetical protein